MHDVAMVGDENLVNTAMKSNHIRKQQSLAFISLTSINAVESNKETKKETRKIAEVSHYE